ncbi:hypothetical protein DdX_14820 [Ditylenchus destructor]|uniref:Uncharacterized protein n=1 Tax=Ditylenchus destructor TaxID=166010 RepID=A0AAD4MR92_9BILA|nr:hypothetical protein DdX_14820 [Ditylenchus destructor]
MRAIRSQKINTARTHTRSTTTLQNTSRKRSVDEFLSGQETFEQRTSTHNNLSGDILSSETKQLLCYPTEESSDVITYFKIHKGHGCTYFPHPVYEKDMADKLRVSM